MTFSRYTWHSPCPKNSREVHEIWPLQLRKIRSSPSGGEKGSTPDACAELLYNTFAFFSIFFSVAVETLGGRLVGLPHVFRKAAIRFALLR